jgi:hypothetical protein
VHLVALNFERRSGSGVRLCFGLGCIADRSLAGGRDFFLWQAEVPVNEDVFTFSIPVDALAVAPILRVVRRKEYESGIGTTTEFFDQGSVTEV